LTDENKFALPGKLNKQIIINLNKKIMKVTAFIGSGRKRHSYIACEKFLQNLHSLGNVEYKIVRLSEYNL